MSDLRAASKLVLRKSLKGLMWSSLVKRTWLAMFCMILHMRVRPLFILSVGCWSMMPDSQGDTAQHTHQPPPGSSSHPLTLTSLLFTDTILINYYYKWPNAISLQVVSFISFTKGREGKRKRGKREEKAKGRNGGASELEKRILSKQNESLIG